MADSALVDGVVSNAATFSIEEWSDLQGRVRRGSSRVLMPYCSCRGHLSVSSLSNQFFKHYSDAVCQYASAGESEEHIFAKQQIALGARAAGWQAHVEAASPPGVERWRADVLAEDSDGTKVAFEVQRSHLSTSGYRDRYRRYARQQIGCVWFIDQDPQGRERLQRSAPAFDIQIDFYEAKVMRLGELGKTEISLAEFTRRWLTGWRPAWPGERSAPLPEDAPLTPELDDQKSSRSTPATFQIRANDLPSRPYSSSECTGTQLRSSILSSWVCMSCRRVE